MTVVSGTRASEPAVSGHLPPRTSNPEDLWPLAGIVSREEAAVREGRVPTKGPPARRASPSAGYAASALSAISAPLPTHELRVQVTAMFFSC